MAKQNGSKGKKGLKDTLKGAAKSVVVELFGKGQGSGFVAGGKAQAVNELRTQKDGRLFAISLFNSLSAPAGRGEFSAVNTESCDDGDFKYPPQSPMIREVFNRIYNEATEAARSGFFVVMTEVIGGGAIGRLSDGTLEKWEAEGRMREMPESAESDPVAIYEKLSAETDPLIPEGHAEEIESFLQDNGPWRRVAMGYLSRPWSEVTARIEKDRNTAVAFASAYQALSDTAHNYQLLADWLKAAEMRLMVALAVREDMKEILKEAKGGQAEAQAAKQDPKAKFLGTQRAGRKLAIDLLKAIPKWVEEGDKGEGYAPFSIIAESPDEPGCLWREGEQAQQIRRYFDMVYKCDRPVRLGFFAVLSDWMAQELTDGSPDADYYEGFEERGLIKDVPGGDNGE